MDPDPKSNGGGDIVDLSRYEAATRNGSGRRARMYHDVVLDFVGEDVFFPFVVLEPIDTESLSIWGALMM